MFLKNTCLDHINTNIITNGVKLLLQEGRWCMVNILYALCVLRCKSGGSSHGITPMRSNNFLVSFKATANIMSATIGGAGGRWEKAYAPPELSEPAITRIRLTAAIENQEWIVGPDLKVWIVKEHRYRTLPFPSPAIRD